MTRNLFKLGFLLSFIIFPVLVMELAGQRLANIPLRLVVFCILSLGGAVLFKKGWPQQGWGTALLITTLGYGVSYKLASYIPDISGYPFSLGWSEASRYYYASLWFPNKLYGISTPPSVLHPSRYLLQSLPFILPQASLFVHRLWQVILWVISASLASWLLVRRLDLKSQNQPKVIILCLLFWIFLYLFQGPIYYHLLVMVVLLLWGFDANHFWRTLILVLLTSLWAGLSRINWLPVPGLLAATLFLLEIPTKGKLLWRYLLPPMIWVAAGTSIAYASQQAHQLWSGNPPAWFGSSFSSDLLWYRLLPNPTFPMGILPSAILVSFPLIGLIILRLSDHWREYHFIRLLGLITILFVLFIGGIVVSVKIGGGSNLHNLDAYLTILLVITTYIYFNRFTPDTSEAIPEKLLVDSSSKIQKRTRSIEHILLGLGIIFPLYFTLSMGGSAPHRDSETAQAALQTIKSATQHTADQGGEVLFITQRHLLTFDYIEGVPLVPEHELVFLMEMAMSNNSAYLDAFHNDIKDQRFAMIVSEPLATQYQGKNHSFGEENDAWVERISEPVLCYYEPTQKVEAAGVVLYTPRAEPCE